MVTVVMVGIEPPTPALFEMVGFSNTSRTCSTSGVGCLWNVTPIDRGPPSIGVRVRYTPSATYMMVTVLVVRCADGSVAAGGRPTSNNCTGSPSTVTSIRCTSRSPRSFPTSTRIS